MVVYTPGLVVTTSLYANLVALLQIASDEFGHSSVPCSVKISALSSCDHEVTALRRRPRPP